MATQTNIEWCDHTFNPWIGCTKVSPGCAHCYAATLMETRYGRVKWGAGQPRQRTAAANWELPLRWNCAAGRAQHDAESDGRALPRRRRVFCASLADWLDEEVPAAWLADMFDLIRRTPHLDWLLLTKRPQNFFERLDAARLEATLAQALPLMDWLSSWVHAGPPANVWIGTTVEDQARADERVSLLLSIPARVRFLSCEPLLEAVDLLPLLPRFSTREGTGGYTPEALHWVICGGESGAGARPMLVEWADDLRRQCETAGIPFFMKQLGAHVGTTNANAHDWPEHVEFREVSGTPQAAGARVVLRDRKGGDFGEFPVELMVRHFPHPRRRA